VLCEIGLSPQNEPAREAHVDHVAAVEVRELARADEERVAAAEARAAQLDAREREHPLRHLIAEARPRGHASTPCTRRCSMRGFYTRRRGVDYAGGARDVILTSAGRVDA